MRPLPTSFAQSTTTAFRMARRCENQKKKRALNFPSISLTHMNTLSAAATSTRPSSLPRGELDLKEKSMVGITEVSLKIRGEEEEVRFFFRVF